MVECVTDNRNRTVADMRHAFSKNNGSMAEPGAVGWQFERKSYFTFPVAKLSFDKAFELAIEAGADDVQEDGDNLEILGPVDAFKTIGDALAAAKVTPDEGGLRLIPKQELELNVEQTLQVLRVVESIEELDDVQSVYHNLMLSDEVLAALEGDE
jgi:transcriptional/translational regulatory protein YebC/TACO1